MPNIKNLTSDQIIKFLLNIGFEIIHQEGSHVQMRRGYLRVTVPHHGKKVLNIKTVYSIIRQTNITKEDLQQM
ncbi:MAG: hypothetical protein CO170_02605 [candidate division SR1 bacterium CG_4_9_14_3_um_filter_40_9]|nr:MAG: hypothetical protein CO170_02605 [candidate division SR1 bacterium CG_4_9_14_3_um_filter_40_9]